MLTLLKPSRGSVRRDVQKKLPPYAWKRQPEHAYAAFLSHYKVEAGMEARYLKMELEGIIKEPCFLDSQDLRNLKLMISEGLLRSDVVVILGTKGYFTRPFCLVEAWCAQRFRVPVVVDAVAMRGFDWKLACEQLSDLEACVDPRGATALVSAIQDVLDAAGEQGEQAPSLKQIGVDIMNALGVGERLEADARNNKLPTSPTHRPRGSITRQSSRKDRRASVDPVNTQAIELDVSLNAEATYLLQQASLHPWGTDNELMADIADLIDLMCLALGRKAPKLQAAFRRQKLNKRRLAQATARLSSGLQAARSKAKLGLSRYLDRRNAKQAADVKADTPSTLSTTMSALSEASVSAATHTLSICCARDEAETVEAAHVLRPVLAETLVGRRDDGVHFEPTGLDGQVASGMVKGKVRRAFGVRDPTAEMADSITRKLHEGVGKARGVLLLQTARVFSDPLSLLEVYWATRKQLPIVCLRLEGGDYDFEKVSVFLKDLEANLYAQSPLDAKVVAAWLDAHMISFSHVATTLAAAIPNILTLPGAFSPNVSENHLAATVEDIRERLQHELGLQERSAKVSSRRECLSGGAKKATRRGRVFKRAVSSEDMAAIRVQSHFRMTQQRRMFQKARRGCVLMQACMRGCAARKRTRELRRQRDALIVIILWTRAWVYRRRRRKLQEAEKKMKWELIVRRQCGGSTAAGRSASTAMPKKVGAHWCLLRDKTATLLARLKTTEEEKAEKEVVMTEERDTEKVEAKQEVAAESSALEELQAKFEALEKANKELQLKIANAGPEEPSSEASPLRFKDGKRPTALSIGVEAPTPLATEVM